MKHTNEAQAILTAIFAINRTSGYEDKDITLVLDYAFRRLFGANTNLLILSCIGKTKEQMMPEVMQLLHIHSLDGQMDEITVLEELGNNSYLVDYRGVKCSAIFNPFNCTYYADNIYGIVKEETSNG